ERQCTERRRRVEILTLNRLREVGEPGAWPRPETLIEADHVPNARSEYQRGGGVVGSTDPRVTDTGVSVERVGSQTQGCAEAETHGKNVVDRSTRGRI